MFNKCFFSFLLLLLSSGAVSAATWIDTIGKITNTNGDPVCAMVLSNGQHMFSCKGDGKYNLRVPLDSAGTVTLMVFASGYEPYRMTLTSGQATVWDVPLPVDSANKPFDVEYVVTYNKRLGWVNVTGDVSLNSQALCSMVLANGQSMFTCGVNKGKYTLTVPLDYNGVVTLMSFVSGLSPMRGDLNIPPALLNLKQAERLNGKWTGSVGGRPPVTYTIDGTDTFEWSDYPGEYGVMGVDPYGNKDVAAWYENEGYYILIDSVPNSSNPDYFVFTFDSPNQVSGCYYEYYNELAMYSNCIAFSATR